jgi:formylglycine-generating enzyme required for sulfatase activity
MLPAAEVEVLARALSKVPDQRWPSCRAFVEALRQASGASPANMGLQVQGLSREQTLLPLVGEVLSNSLGMRLVRVPRGMFWMGGGGGRPGELQVTIPRDFYLGAFLVTQAQWEALMIDNPSLFSRHGGALDRVATVSDEELRWFPVESVSWAEAQGFLELLNAREVHPGWVYRLPTEAEWEYACRGASASREDSSFDFYGGDGPSNDLSSTEANFDGSKPAGRAAVGPYLGRTCRVGRYRPNRLGLYDLHGNVWEWCDDRYDGGEDRVLRGGGWFNSGAGCRAAARRGDAPTRRHGPTGFRVALVPRR